MHRSVRCGLGLRKVVELTERTVDGHIFAIIGVTMAISVGSFCLRQESTLSVEDLVTLVFVGCPVFRYIVVECIDWCAE